MNDPLGANTIRGANHRVTIGHSGELICAGRNDDGQCVPPSALQQPQSVALGADHTAAIDQRGRVWCWGSNRHGQCETPEDLAPAIDVAAGDSFTAAITGNCEVTIWGNFEDATEPLSSDRGRLVWRPSDVKIVQLRAGKCHLTALTSDGRAFCVSSQRAASSWRSRTPVPKLLSNAKEIATSDYGNIALCHDGAVWRWGDGTSIRTQGDFISVTGGRRHVAALGSDGRVTIWGWPCSWLPWQLTPAALLDLLVTQGNNLSEEFRSYLLEKLRGTLIKQWARTWDHLLVLQTDGKLFCVPPLKLSMSKDLPESHQPLIQVACGWDFAIALTTDGRSITWLMGESADRWGILETPAPTESLTAIAAGATHCVALGESGTVAAWGNNSDGQCDVGDIQSDARAIAAGRNWTAIQLHSGQVLIRGTQCNSLPWKTPRPWLYKLLRDDHEKFTTDGIDSLLQSNPEILLRQQTKFGRRFTLLDPDLLLVTSSAWQLTRDCVRQVAIEGACDFAICEEFAVVLTGSGEIRIVRDQPLSGLEVAQPDHRASARLGQTVTMHAVRHGVWLRRADGAVNAIGRVRNLAKCPWEVSATQWAAFIDSHAGDVDIGSLPDAVRKHPLVHEALSRAANRRVDES
jgi:alpha-tubulin suppressor-like RCC1 family protein